jgi:DNA-binding NarL/FixJ family response regulator
LVTIVRRTRKSTQREATRAAVAVMGKVLDAFATPAFLATKSGGIVHANAAARKHFSEAPTWLGSALRNPSRHAERAAITRLHHDGASLYLVLPRTATGAELPPSLARVADLLVQGMSDKEVARSLGLSARTVRTFVSRIYARLGVSSRIQLARAWRQAR